MTAQTILEELRSLGREGYKRILLNHGVPEPCFGVKIEDLKRIQKRLQTNHRLALELYDTGVYDAMYLAGLIADDAQMTRTDLRRWARQACGPLAGATVPWVAAGSPHGHTLALEWIESNRELVATAGWATLSGLVAIEEDAKLDLAELKRLLERVQRTIHQAPDTVRQAMNGFVIAVGCHVAPLTPVALRVAEAIGPVTLATGKTACRVPSTSEAIRKAEQRGLVGRKRRTAKC